MPSLTQLSDVHSQRDIRDSTVVGQQEIALAKEPSGLEVQEEDEEEDEDRATSSTVSKHQWASSFLQQPLTKKISKKMTSVLESLMNVLGLNEKQSDQEEAKLLKRYDIQEEINHGAFSKVYNAIDRQTRLPVAIKKMPKAKLKPKQKENILREAAIHKRLQNQFIVQFIDFVDTTEYYYLVMELMKGGELFERIEQVEFFTEQDAIMVITQVAKGIKYLHDNGVVHRDIKPENLVFSNKTLYPIKICDFGLSKILGNESTDTPCGTVGYLAPEIAKEGNHSFGVDIWALGCVLYSMLCGFPAFYDQSIAVLNEKVKRGIYDFPSPWWDDVSHLAKDLIRHCLTVDPAKRYNINQFLQHPWLHSEGSTLPLQSPAILKQMDKNVQPLKNIFDVAYATQRDLMEEYEQRQNPPKPRIEPKPVIEIGSKDVKTSTLLAKRAHKKAIAEGGSSSNSSSTSASSAASSSSTFSMPATAHQIQA